MNTGENACYCPADIPCVGYPAPGSDAELELFNTIQQSFAGQYETVFPDKLAAKTVIVVPSLTLDQEVLSAVVGVQHYEERLLCLLMLLRMPRTRIIYITSMPIDQVIVDYYLHLLPGITGYHARERLTLLSCYDASPVALTAKILRRDRLMQRIRQYIPPGCPAHIACFNTTELERTLCVRLGIPMFACDPVLNCWGTKSGSRAIFRRAGVAMPDGRENLHTRQDIARVLMALKQQHPLLRKAVVKLNDGFSGDGNAIFRYADNSDTTIEGWLAQINSRLQPVANALSLEDFLQKFEQMGGIVEAFVEGAVKESPSVQCRINPSGEIDIISTHDQVLNGDNGQVFTGAHFPANQQYSSAIAQLSLSIAQLLKEEGVLGRFGIDFISVFEAGKWHHYAIEINLRKGGTTHPFLMLQFLTDGHFDADTGLFETPAHQHRYYFASDNLCNEQYKGLTPHDLIDIAMLYGLHFDGTAQKGVVFHMIGALSQYGKMGVVCIGASPAEAFDFYQRTVAVMDRETSAKQQDRVPMA